MSFLVNITTVTSESHDCMYLLFFHSYFVFNIELHYISEKPNVAFSCFRRNKVNEGDDFTCVCRGEGNYPPANVTWYKDGAQIGRTRKENQTLTLSNVNGTQNGTCKCEARSYPSDEFLDAKYMEVRLNCKCT